MSRDNWERLVAVVLRREQLRQMFHEQSRSPSITSISTDFCPSSTHQFPIDGLSSFSVSQPSVAASPALRKTSSKKNGLNDSYSTRTRQRKKLQKLPPEVRKLVDVLREIQAQHDYLESNFYKERAALEARYRKLSQPLYAKRYRIVNQVDGDEKGVPDFWLTAMKNNEVVARELSEHDEEALKFLKEIKSSKVEYRKGFRLEFHFDPNPFFKNSVLTKTYRTVDEGEPVLDGAIGTKIEWFPGKNLTHKIMQNKPRKWSKIINMIAGTEKRKSFFNLFSTYRGPDIEDLYHDIARKLQHRMVRDYEIGLIIRDKIVPHAVSWYMGEDICYNVLSFRKGKL
ncbi:nucleosome assembly protein 1;1-like [Sesamum indicum]|uniref:Nucleosome assembly protein 11-like n=1 Tax=Sesamum indicum TaxID=4182 RepID=A0A8M8V9M1_SESIN|nr:nucleosome assembly protein 1;1-like [Sesamum indicum]